MSSEILACQWEVDAIGSDWSVNTVSVPDYVAAAELGTAMAAGASGFVQCPFPRPGAVAGTPNAGDFRHMEELRFWLRSSRPGDNSSGRPFYLVFEIVSDASPDFFWRWLLPIKQRNAWELHRIWLGAIRADLQPLRAAVSALRFRSLTPEFTFVATVGDVIATVPEPLQDVDAALFDRLHERFQVTVEGAPVNVPAIFDLPENPGDRARPYLLLIPWAVQPDRESGGSGELIDNYWLDHDDRTGGCTRPPTWQVQIDFAIDAYANERSHKTYLLDQILRDFSRQPFLRVNGEPLPLIPFVPTPEETTELSSPGRTPLFYRLTIQIETGDRQSRGQAMPFLVVGHQFHRSETETVSLQGPTSP